MVRVKYRLQGKRMMETADTAEENPELLYDVPISGTVYGAALNYRAVYDALAPEMHKHPYREPPKAPVLFIKPVNTHVAHRGFIPMPKERRSVTIGASLGIVIGRTATRVDAEGALDYVEGYTIVNDVSIPHESVYRPAYKEKARDGFCPIGPFVVEQSEVADPNNLDIRVYINDVLRQENNTSNLVRTVEQLIMDVTEFMTLYEGDVLLAGSPEMMPQAGNGDVVKIDISGIGRLTNEVKDENEVSGGEGL
ncbi:fumarylacetoacetate hydrolase family protein [Salinicoccus carnicancri]|uniref:fumarylacetoacetate hydrolase family protein n=1 Tax=Salinicoccus carnicancri TaxID=558170 RepID=UPI0002EC7E84|nr:fumarylacetoacetate hydrolase family protein [Salinicoccus carnicancri]